MENTKLLTWLIVAALAVNVIFGFALYNKNVVAEVPEIDVPTPVISDQDKADIAGLVVANLPVAPEPSEEGPLDNDKLDALYEDLTDISEEDKAEELALDELDDRDFKKALRSCLNDEGASIEDYKDFETVLVKDVDVDVSGEDAEVEFELKASYFEDGDDDVEDVEKAKVLFTFEVEDLDSDDDFEDAEVVDYDASNCELIKFYD